ncbi:MAG: inositol monophosphatase [Deltaproteobacteria bacterium]|nr:inositol monophosphatase [Deltaproteobacteria bacterium]
MKEFLEIAKQASLISGEIQMSHLEKTREIDFKGEINIVTEVDKKCEAEIVSLIQKTYPHHDILAEEGSGVRRDSEYKWIIDPLDGTTNYAHRYPLFCTSIALEYRGEIVVGVVYEPNRKELFEAEKGSGAFCNGQKISVSKNAQLKNSLLCTGFAYNLAQTTNNNLDHFRKFLHQARGVRRDGVAAVDLCYVAMGRYDGFWELDLFPWDVAAGALMIREAGGVVSDFSGREFQIYSKELLASNRLLHPSMLQTLKR